MQRYFEQKLPLRVFFGRKPPHARIARNRLNASLQPISLSCTDHLNTRIEPTTNESPSRALPRVLACLSSQQRPKPSASHAAIDSVSPRPSVCSANNAKKRSEPTLSPETHPILLDNISMANSLEQLGSHSSSTICVIQNRLSLSLPSNSNASALCKLIMALASIT